MRRVWRGIYADHSHGSRRQESRRPRSGCAARAALRIGPVAERRRPRRRSSAWVDSDASRGRGPWRLARCGTRRFSAKPERVRGDSSRRLRPVWSA